MLTECKNPGQVAMPGFLILVEIEKCSRQSFEHFTNHKIYCSIRIEEALEELYKKGVREMRVALVSLLPRWLEIITEVAKEEEIEILIVDSLEDIREREIDFLLVGWDIEELPAREVPWGMLILEMKHDAVAEMRRAFKAGAKDVWDICSEGGIRQMFREIKEGYEK